MATTIAVIGKPPRSERARWVELGNANGAASAATVFALLALIQRVS